MLRARGTAARPPPVATVAMSVAVLARVVALAVSALAGRQLICRLMRDASRGKIWSPLRARARSQLLPFALQATSWQARLLQGQQPTARASDHSPGPRSDTHTLAQSLCPPQRRRWHLPEAPPDGDRQSGCSNLNLQTIAGTRRRAITPQYSPYGSGAQDDSEQS